MNRRVNALQFAVRACLKENVQSLRCRQAARQQMEGQFEMVSANKNTASGFQIIRLS
jgi:hypothetical protein